MKRLFVFALCLCLCSLSAFSKGKGKLTYITAEIQGCEAKTIYFDFVEREDLNMQFPYVENQKMELAVELNDVTMLNINSWINIALEPGDSIHAKIVYEGRYHKSVEYTGTPSAVAIGNALQKIREFQREDGYKENIPAALVTLVEAKGYFAKTYDIWQKEKAVLNDIKDQVSERVYNYVLSGVDALFVGNLITYPFASSSFHKKNINDCIADNYWTALDDFKLRDDDASLRNRSYMSFLLTYKEYMRCKNAGCDPSKFNLERPLEEQYADVADFYDGKLRDAALFVVLYNALAKNGDFEQIQKLSKDYLKKYNKNKEYKKILSQVMK